MDTIRILRKGRVAKRKTMNKTLKQAVIEKSINNALKIALKVTMHVEKATLLQVRKQNKPSAKDSEKILRFTQHEHLRYSIEQEKSGFKELCRYPNIKQQKEQWTRSVY